MKRVGKPDSATKRVAVTCSALLGLFWFWSKVVNLSRMGSILNQPNRVNAILFRGVSFSASNNFSVASLEAPIPVVVIFGLPNFKFLFVCHVS